MLKVRGGLKTVMALVVAIEHQLELAVFQLTGRPESGAAEPGQPEPGLAVEGGKFACHQNSSIRLDSHRTDGVVRSEAWVAIHVQRAIEGEPGQTRMGLFIIAAKGAPD